MSDSVRLQFEHGIWYLVFSYVFLAIIIVSGFLTFLVSGFFFILTFLSFFFFTILIECAIDCFKDAIAISKKEGEKENLL